MRPSTPLMITSSFIDCSHFITDFDHLICPQYPFIIPTKPYTCFPNSFPNIPAYTATHRSARLCFCSFDTFRYQLQNPSIILLPPPHHTPPSIMLISGQLTTHRLNTSSLALLTANYKLTSTSITFRSNLITPNCT